MSKKTKKRPKPVRIKARIGGVNIRKDGTVERIKERDLKFTLVREEDE
jgi:hypothetical protein